MITYILDLPRRTLLRHSHELNCEKTFSLLTITVTNLEKVKIKNVMYVKNKIISRTADLKPLPWNQQKEIGKGIIELEGEYTFDLYHDADRERWFEYFKQHNTKIRQKDYFYIARQLAVKKDIEKINDPNLDFAFGYIPKKYTESPRAFLYNELIDNQELIKRHLLPALRKAHVFSPLTPFLESKFFSFVMPSFDLHIIKIPDFFKMKEIFKVTFKMTFDLHKYFEWLVINKKARFYLDLWPEMKLRMKYTHGFPFVFIGDKANFYRSVEDTVLRIMLRNNNILRYIYTQTKLRLDKVGGFKIIMDRLSDEIVIRPNDSYTFVAQTILGKIDIFSQRAPAPGLTVQKISPDFVRSNIGLANEATMHLLYHFIMAVLFTRRKRHPSKTEVQKMIKDIQRGKVKIQDLTI